MPPYVFKRTQFNIDFARALIKAYLIGKKTFIFKKHKYTTRSYIDHLAEDIKNGLYVIQVKEA